MNNDWQYTNQFFEEGKLHFYSGGNISDCPYDYLKIYDEEDISEIQAEMYRENEWREGFRTAFRAWAADNTVVSV